MNYYGVKRFLPGNPDNSYKSIGQASDDNINSLGYRAPEFDTVNWKDSVVIFGCSYVFGFGLNYDETISYLLEQEVGRPVINMGVPASSIEYSVTNQITLLELNVTPYAVINCWSSLYRILYFDNDYPMHLGPWTSEVPTTSSSKQKKLLNETWNFNSLNPEAHSYTLKRIADLLWKDTKHIQGSFFKKTAEHFDVELFHQFDVGSDGVHPGPKTALSVAKILKQQL